MIQIDMEMPKNCKFCPLHDVNPDQCPIRTIYKDDYATSRFTDCPLYKIAEDTDTISRQAAIDAHYEYCNKHPDAGFPVWSLKILEDLPPAQPEKHTEKHTETHACDCISRQAAIEAIFNEPLCESGMKERTAIAVVLAIYEKINSLPSAQPETHEKRTKTHACDLISRQAAIDAMNTITKWSLLDRNGYHVGVGMKYRDVKETVKNLPPSPTLGRQAEPQTTEWLMGGVSYINEESVYCSKCRWAWSKKEDLGFFEYCPNCGRKILYRGKWRKVSKNESQGGAV